MTITSLSKRAPSKRATSRHHLAGWVLLVLCAAPAIAPAQQQRQQAQQQATYQPNYNAINAQQANQQAILQDKLRTSQLQEEQRQRNAAAIRQPLSSNPSATQPLDLANQAQQDRFNARQRDAVDQYRAASSSAPVVLPQPVRPSSTSKKPPPSALDQLHPTPSTQSQQQPQH